MTSHELSPDQQNALERIARGDDASADETRMLVEAGLVVRDDGNLRLTDRGECLMLAGLPALRQARGIAKPARANQMRRAGLATSGED